MLPAFGRVNSSPASFFTETSVVATSSRVIVCPTFATTLEGVDVLPVVVGVLPETVPVVAVVPQAMSPANRIKANRMAIGLRWWLMGFFPFLELNWQIFMGNICVGIRIIKDSLPC